MLRKKSIKDEKLDNGKLNTMVIFSSAKPKGRLPNQAQEQKELFKSWAEVYNPSLKDIEIMRGKGIQRAVTIVIRNPLGSYLPKNSHFVTIKDKAYEGLWGIEDIRPSDRYITLLLKGDFNGTVGN